MKKILFILMLITSCICLSCNNSNREIIYSYVNGYGDVHLTLGNVGGWGAEVKSHEYKNGIGKITFKSTITSIPEFAFINSKILKSITIPNSVTSIGERAFYGCSSLTSVTIPDSVTSIEYEAFLCCSSLTSVYCKAKTPPSGEPYMFDNNTWNRKIYVPRNSVKAYKSAKYWKDYTQYIVGYDFE